MRRGVFPFGLASPLPAQPRGLVLLPKGPHHKPVQAVGRLVVNHVRELIRGEKRKRERGVFSFLFPGCFSCPRPATKRETSGASQKPSSKPAATRLGISPAAKVNTSREGKKNPVVNPKTLQDFFMHFEKTIATGAPAWVPFREPLSRPTYSPLPLGGNAARSPKCWAAVPLRSAHRHVPRQRSASRY